MKIYRLKIEGYKRIINCEILFGDTTFLIGPNNSGKSSVLNALKHLLSPLKKIPEIEYYSENDEDTNERKTVYNTITLEAEFRNVPVEAKNWKGFKGRIFEYSDCPENESGLSITYRKTYELGKDVITEIKTKKRVLKDVFSNIQTPQDLIDKGILETVVNDLFSDKAKKINNTDKLKYEDIDDMWELEDSEEWFKNPGGIPQVVLSRLPRYIIIPADTSTDEINKGILVETLNELFEDVRNTSNNYIEAQKYLDKLAKEMNPADSSSEFGKMLEELNEVISAVFPESKIYASADLSDPNKSLRPSFEVQLSSNIKTKVEHQGAGMIRSAVFGIFRFRQKWLARREDKDFERSIIIGFEEPEIYLHPSAANQMRDTIYELSSINSQIIATTHSPYLIDLTRQPRQILNRFSHNLRTITVDSFSITDAFTNLQSDDKNYIKMIAKIDDYVSRVFFTKKVVIVEGDTEEVVIRESLNRLPKDIRLSVYSKCEIIKARGKAAIIGLSKYLLALGITHFIIHDRDLGVERAEIFNKPIQDLVGNQNVIQLEECIEDILGYPPPKSEKPYKAYLHTLTWGADWWSIPEKWRNILTRAFDIEIKDKKSPPEASA